MSAERRGCKKLAECYVVIDFYKNVIRIKRVRFEFRPPGPTKGAGGGGGVHLIIRPCHPADHATPDSNLFLITLKSHLPVIIYQRPTNITNAKVSHYVWMFGTPWLQRTNINSARETRHA